MAGGASSKSYGAWQNWLVALITLVVVTGLNHFGKGFLKLSSVLIGIIVGYVVALGFGMVDFSSVLTGKMGTVSTADAFRYQIRAFFMCCNSVSCSQSMLYQAIGDFSATTTGSMDRMPTDEELRGGIVGYGSQ